MTFMPTGGGHLRRPGQGLEHLEHHGPGPDHDSIASQAQHTADIEREAREGSRGVVARVVTSLRRLVRRS